MKQFSPAKINLFLKVWGRKADGFHLLSTWFRTLLFGDDLSLSLAPQDQLCCNVPSLISQDNLIWKATYLFRKYTNIRSPVCWSLKKRIPLQSGLGGGSSNAATALFMLNQLFQTNLSEETLAQYGKVLGADVPAFFSLGSAFGDHKGDECITLSLQDHADRYVLYFSNQGVSTKQAFAGLLPSDLTKTKPTFFQNDLERSVFRFRADLKNKKTFLERIWSPFQANVMLSGSGATFFVRYSMNELTEEQNLQINKLIRDTRGILVRTINRTPGTWYSNQ